MERLAWVLWYMLLGICFIIGLIMISTVVIRLWCKTDLSFTECRHAANMWAFEKALGGEMDGS